jgi:hypothetical protein
MSATTPAPDLTWFAVGTHVTFKRDDDLREVKAGDPGTVVESFAPHLGRMVRLADGRIVNVPTVDLCEAEPLAEPCDTQDTIAAALVPGDVVLGPDGWVIVLRVVTNLANHVVRIHGENRAAPFERTFEYPVTVQPDADTESSASRQSFIETGRYLRRA